MPRVPAAPIVLIAPAMAIRSTYYAPVEQAFTARGWAARTLPRRGFERTDAPASRGNDWAYEDEMAVVGDAVAAARAEDPARPVLVLGHSLGGQVVLGAQHGPHPADGLVLVGACLPHHRGYPALGVHVAAMAALLVPVSTAAWGYLPRPLFGAPGARTLMRQWARMALTGRPPFATPGPVTAPSLHVALRGDSLAPRRAIDAFADRFFAPEATTRWTHDDGHLEWVRTPDPVADRVVTWWT